MKEQDYMKLMGSIRGDFLEEAVSWDGSERRRIRQIRRMTVSFGAVAAALAVVIGMIAYKANRDKIDTANSDTENSTVEDLETTENLYGGHGELRQITGTNGTICYDDDYVYEGDARWSVRSGGKVVRLTEDQIPDNLFMDGENLFTVHDSKIFETDSFGKETELVDLASFQFPMQIDPAQICGLRKLSERLLCIEYNENAQYPTLLIADLQNSMAYQQDDPTFCILFPDSEISYYAFSTVACTLARYELSVGSLSRQSIRNMDEYRDFGSFAVRDGSFYTTAKQYQIVETGPESLPEQYLSVDLRTGELKEETFSLSERVFAGNAFIRSAYEDGKFCLYRSGLDRGNEQQVFSVPFEQYMDTAKYGTPDVPSFLSVYESDDMIIVHLPLMCSGIPCPAKHGEDGVLIDLKNGKVLYYGDNYDFSTPEDSSSLAEAIVTTAAAGGTGTGTGMTGTAVSGTGTETTAKTAAQTTAAQAFTVAEGSNIFGGKGSLTWLGGDLWADNAYVYSSEGSRFTYHAAESVMLNYAENICDKKDCRHDNESCIAYHYNMWQSRPDSNDYVRNGRVVKPVQCSGEGSLWMQRGNDLYRVNMDDGTETRMLRITQINGMTLGEDDLFVSNVSVVHGAGGTVSGKYLVSCAVSLDVPGVNPDVTYTILADTVSQTQKLVAQPGPEGADSTIGVLLMQDTAADGSFYSVKNGNVIMEFDSSFTNKKEYRLPDGELAQIQNLWCVYDHVFWFMNAKEQWCSFDLNTGAFRVVRENVPVSHYENYAPVMYRDGMFFAIRASEDGYSRTLLMFRYDWANSEEHHIQNITPLVGLGYDIKLFNDTYYVPFSAQDGTGIFVANLPEWAPLS